jgi:hypothetical protein
VREELEFLAQLSVADAILTGMQTKNWKMAKVVRCAIQYSPSGIDDRISILGA